jgi:hypothetical protein
MAAVDLGAMSRQLNGGVDSSSPEPVLVTPKVSKLCSRLLACKVYPVEFR